MTFAGPGLRDPWSDHGSRNPVLVCAVSIATNGSPFRMWGCPSRSVPVSVRQTTVTG